jgi:hypothetical protein
MIAEFESVKKDKNLIVVLQVDPLIELWEAGR